MVGINVIFTFCNILINKHMKKLFILLSSSIMLAAFAACGDDNNEPNQPVTPPDPDPIVEQNSCL